MTNLKSPTIIEINVAGRTNVSTYDDRLQTRDLQISDILLEVIPERWALVVEGLIDSKVSFEPFAFVV